MTAELERCPGAQPSAGARTPVLTETGQPRFGTAVVHRGLNRPAHGWPVCAPCHGELTHGGHLARFARTPEFRAFQTRVLEQRRRARQCPGDEAL